MKKIIVLLKFGLLAVFIGAVLLVAGIITEILALTIIGGCFIGAYVILACLSYILALTDSIKRRGEKNNGNEKLVEEESVREINSSVGISNEAAVHERQLATAAHSVRHMGAIDKITVAFLAVLISGGLAAVITLIVFSYNMAAVCTACGVIAVVGGFIFCSLLYAKSRLRGEIDEAVEPVEGEVVSCINFAEISESSGVNNAYQSTQKTRIVYTVYKLRVAVSLERVEKGEGRAKKFTVFSRVPYNAGDCIKLRVCKNNKNRYMIDE
ncbi:MAG: hypothetical protein NC033_01290 [Clostridiales bacterium]|nr:hypothetical protein [Clostridiales bacterium]